MSKKLFVMLSTIIGAVGTIASAVVTYFQPAHAAAIVASIGIAVTAATEIMLQFVDEQALTKKK